MAKAMKTTTTKRMANKSRPQRAMRQKKSDRMLWPGTPQEEIMVDYALAPFDEVSRAMDRKWGVDRLVELVSVETAQKFGSAMAKLNAAIDECDPAMAAARAQVCIKGLNAMDAEATKSGAEPASDEVWIIEADGHVFGLMRDARAWQRAQDKFPSVELITEREMVLALLEYKQSVVKASVDAVKAAFPGAEVTALRITKKEMNDEIPF